jgi:hypothetical protein
MVTTVSWPTQSKPAIVRDGTWMSSDGRDPLEDCSLSWVAILICTSLPNSMAMIKKAEELCRELQLAN